MLELANDQDLDQRLATSQTPVILYFWAPWSKPCRSLDPAVEELASMMSGQLTCLRINVDDNAHSPAQYGVKKLPHLAMVREGRVIDSIEGRHPLGQFRDFIQKNITT
ncbi:MAG: thioredoxin family protein [Oligoflexus sp.]